MQTQRKIADFLDTKCSEIDALTVDIQTQIDTLEQYKRSIITEAVTRGHVQKDRYLTEQEQAQYDKIQSEQELAEEDAIQAQQPEMEKETPKSTLGEQFEQSKTVVTAAIYEDTAYRNACGHSDRENAVIEGNACLLYTSRCV